MIRVLGIVILLSFTSMIWGQTSGNPFDLKYRAAKPTTIQPSSSKPTTQDSFPKPEGTPQENNPIQESKSAPKDSARFEINQLTKDTSKAGSGHNPFEIDKGLDSQATIAMNPVDPNSKPGPGKDIKPPALKKKSSKGIQIFFVLLSLLLLIFIVNVERSFVRDLWKVISNENYSSLHHRNQRNTMRQILLMMGYTVFVLQGSLFLFNVLHIYNHTSSMLSNIWVCLAFVIIIYLTRHAVIRYLRWLFNNDKEMTLFGFDISIFNTMVGLMLLPINILLLFGPDSIYKPLIIIGVVSILAAYSLRQLRWMFTARHLISNSLFLFFVYLCAVEILPLWAISKLFW